MNNDQNVVDSFLGDLKNTGADPFTQNDDPFANSPIGKGEDKNEEGSEDVEGEGDNKPIPYHQDPKLQRYIQKEIAKGISKNKPSATESFVKDVAATDTEADEILTRIIGNDTAEKRQAVSDFKKYLASLEEKGAKKAMAQLEAQAQAQEAEEAQAREELESGFESIEDQFGVDITSNTPQSNKLRNDFISFVRRVSPKDQEGDVIAFPDLTETFALFQDATKRSNNKAKTLSSRSMTRSAEAKAPVSTDQSFKAAEKYISSLQN